MNKIIFTLLLALLVSINYCFAQVEEKLTITHGPYLQNVTEERATIVFTTNKLAAPGVMIKCEDEIWKKIQNSHDGLIDVGDNIQKVRVDNLLPGQQYEYKLFAYEIENYDPFKNSYGDTVVSGIYKFRTFDQQKRNLNFTMFFDLHDDSSKLSKYLDFNDIEKQYCYFFNVDMVGHVEEDSQLFSSFIDVCVSRFATRKPFYFVRGNHEARGKYARQLKNYFDFPDNKYYYAFNLGPVHFIVLDGGEDKPDNHQYYSGLADFDKYRKEQLKWLQEKVESDDFKNALFKIVVIHMPIIKNDNNWYGMAFLAEHFGPVLGNKGIDLMISGHMHQNVWIDSGKSGFDYPVMICSHNNFVEAEVTEKKILIKLKGLNGKVEEINIIERKD